MQTGHILKLFLPPHPEASAALQGARNANQSNIRATQSYPIPGDGDLYDTLAGGNLFVNLQAKLLINFSLFFYTISVDKIVDGLVLAGYKPRST